MNIKASTVFGLYSALGVAAAAAVYNEVPEKLLQSDLSRETTLTGQAIDLCYGKDFAPTTLTMPIDNSCATAKLQELKAGQDAERKFNTFVILLLASIGAAGATASLAKERREQDRNGPQPGL
jgi:hypothetical protein